MDITLAVSGVHTQTHVAKRSFSKQHAHTKNDILNVNIKFFSKSIRMLWEKKGIHI